MITKDEIKATIREAFQEHLAHYDRLAHLPESASLREAAKITGVSLSTLRYYVQAGTLETFRVGNGRGTHRVPKHELLKLINETTND